MRASVLFRVYRYTALCSGEAKFYIDDISDARQAPEQRVQFCRSRRPSANCLFSGEKKGEKRLKSTRRSARLDHAPTLIAPITARHRFQGPRIFCIAELDRSRPRPRGGVILGILGRRAKRTSPVWKPLSLPTRTTMQNASTVDRSGIIESPTCLPLAPAHPRRHHQVRPTLTQIV
ncbi:hypothetical protein L1887_60008 [Cichorium endivia]|nr:hypothetical protein L1887_60008 [Cichorium endivia]